MKLFDYYIWIDIVIELPKLQLRFILKLVHIIKKHQHIYIGRYYEVF